MKDQTPDLLELLAALIQILVRDLELHIDFFDVGNTVATIGSLSRHRILLFICVDYHAPIPATLAGIIILSCCIGLLKFLDLLLRGLGQVIQLRQYCLVAQRHFLNQCSFLLVNGRLPVDRVALIVEIKVQIVDLFARLIHKHLIVAQHFRLGLEQTHPGRLLILVVGTAPHHQVVSVLLLSVER